MNTSRLNRPPLAGRPAGGLAAGFTLMEVMIVVVIVGILLAVALPSYNSSLEKGRRADAKAALLDASNRQEQFMLDRSTYTLNMTELGFGADPMVSEEGHYTVDAAACAAGTIQRCYVLTATPVAGGAQANDTRCTTLILDSTGAKTATGSDLNNCW
ncbi:type IV pilin protein [Pseudohalioglobus lutimaris]|nr:type IV pilin protein [Pseudohalioglobus lutimaris]